MTISAACLGFPRVGARHELNGATEGYLAGRLSADQLQDAAKGLRAAGWERQRQAGVDVIPCNDFSLHDQVLDTSVMVGAIPDRYRPVGPPGSLDLAFAMAQGGGVVPSEVQASQTAQWFETSDQYIVPEVSPDQQFALSTRKVLNEFNEAKALGYHCRPVILGPVTFLHLAKSTDPSVDPLSLLNRLLPVYAELLLQLKLAGADWVQIDEPVMVRDMSAAVRAALRTTYWSLAGRGAPKIMLATYFGAIGDNLDAALGLPVAGLHLDLVCAPEQLALVLGAGRQDLVLSLGVVDGREAARSDLVAILDRLEPLVGKIVIQIAPSCSLGRSPVHGGSDTPPDRTSADWLALATRKLEEVATLSVALRRGRGQVADALADNAAAMGVLAQASERRRADRM
ncbi:hypothetical protein [Sphingomonas sp.]|jgi:5-methyltetrahydropteroyltriglutamate--homocysteine methyltransferase|uniref:hypothetical protein n=1 Tax=Sphingomonas sp. TaxID=28214 RepID=UPI00261872FA|nr:hypothetical protein [Sphingomonas sp.]MDF2494199.1 metE [Sphingomonas sp.]